MHRRTREKTQQMQQHQYPEGRNNETKTKTTHAISSVKHRGRLVHRERKSSLVTQSPPPCESMRRAKRMTTAMGERPPSQSTGHSPSIAKIYVSQNQLGEPVDLPKQRPKHKKEEENQNRQLQKPPTKKINAVKTNQIISTYLCSVRGRRNHQSRGERAPSTGGGRGKLKK